MNFAAPSRTSELTFEAVWIGFSSMRSDKQTIYDRTLHFIRRHLRRAQLQPIVRVPIPFVS
jgi:hypothetical protein